MSYTVTKKELLPQAALIGRRRVDRSEIAKAIGEILPRAFRYAQEQGLTISGRPFARYMDVGPGLLTIEPGIPVASAGAHAHDGLSSDESKVMTATLPGGPAACTIHAGSYEGLRAAYGALEAWIESNGYVPSGAPWESYLTDPAEHPDPKDWRTEVVWPIAERTV